LVLLRRLMISMIPGFYGVVGPLIILAFILVAISQSSWFSWTENSLSDLGASRDAAAALFNSGLIIGGVLITLFGIGLKATMPGLTRGSVGAIAVILGGLALCSAGIFTNRSGMDKVVHLYTSGLLFALFIVALLLIGSAMMQDPEDRNLGLFVFKMALLVGIVGVALLAGQLAQGAMAILEFIIALGTSACYIILGVRFFKRSLPLKPTEH